MSNSSKSKIVMQMNLERMLERGHAYFWTFTFKDVLSVKIASEAWSRFLHDGLREKYPGIYGLRVFELHPGGHGLHVHCLVSDYIEHSELKDICSRYGIGNIWVEKMEGRRLVGYLGKYLNKSAREPAFHRMRLWQCFGERRKDMSRIKDLKIIVPSWEAAWQELSHVKNVRKRFAMAKKMVKACNDEMREEIKCLSLIV